MTKNVIDTYYDNLKKIIKDTVDTLDAHKKAYGHAHETTTLDALQHEKDKLLIAANQLANTIRSLDLPSDFDINAIAGELKLKAANQKDKQETSTVDANVDGRAHGASQGVVRGLDTTGEVVHNNHFSGVKDEVLNANRVNTDAADKEQAEAKVKGFSDAQDKDYRQEGVAKHNSLEDLKAKFNQNKGAKK